MATQVKSTDQLKTILADGETKDFFILLNFGLRSSKAISYDGSSIFYVLNEIDGTEQELTEQELMNGDITNIGKAINNGAFYLD
jgi:hypothetical protein